MPFIPIDHANFHIEDIDLEFTNTWETWEMLILWVSAKSHLDTSTDFISDHSFQNRTYSESPRNFQPILHDILHDHVASVLKFWEYFKHHYHLGIRTMYIYN